MHKRRKGSLFACCFYICLEMLMSYGACTVFTISSSGGEPSQKSSRAKRPGTLEMVSPLVRRHWKVSLFHPCVSSISVLTQQGKLFSSPVLHPSRERAPPSKHASNPQLRFPWGPQVVTIPWTQQHHGAPSFAGSDLSMSLFVAGAAGTQILCSTAITAKGPLAGYYIPKLLGELHPGIT